jgi:hypothetical protein
MTHFISNPRRRISLHQRLITLYENEILTANEDDYIELLKHKIKKQINQNNKISKNLSNFTKQ